ncbi:C39 family peptidase, partial [Limosilactobacillus reuteri]|uniref:C39 family peptidase n=1 Tax=Limosilactobacillus reuteri TaxID=1598 RepID=UPI000ABB1DB9
IVDGTGTSLNQLEKFIDKGQPVIIYHTSLGSKTLRSVFHFDNQPKKIVSNIHGTLLIGYDDEHYYYIDPLWSRLTKFVIFQSIIPKSKQIHQN